MKKFILLSIAFAFLFFGGFISASDLTRVRDVDYVSVMGYVKNGNLEVSLIYKNKDTDNLVYWEDGKVMVYYTIYKWEGNSIKGQKGSKLLEGEKALTRYNQDFYIEIPSFYIDGESYALIECLVNTNYTTINVTETFKLRK